MADKTRVVVVDDNQTARSFFELYIRYSANYELVGSLPDAGSLAAFLSRHPADLLLMDVLMRGGPDGLTAARQIKATDPQIKIIIVTSTSETQWEKLAKEIGVESFWYKEYSEEPLLAVMDRTMAGESVYPTTAPEVSFGMVSKSDLTERELDVLRELTNGSSNEEIAQALYISVNTVKKHIQNMLDKTGYDNRLDLAVNARALGLVISEADRTGN